MRIDVEFEITPLQMGEVFVDNLQLGETFTEKIVVQNVTETLHVNPEGDAIVMTTSLPVSTNDESISIRGA